MKDIFLVNYKVKGIKTLDSMVSLSFYKKTITMPIERQNYNIKGIYGMNGSGKSGIISSVDILRNLLKYADYLNNHMVQKNLDLLVNKKSKELYIGVEFLVNVGNEAFLYKYEIVLKKNSGGKFVIDFEQLSYKNAVSKKEELELLVEVKKGEIIRLYEKEKKDFNELFIKKTANLLSNATVSALLVEKLFRSGEMNGEAIGFLSGSIGQLYVLGSCIYVYMDQSDNYSDYLLNEMYRSSKLAYDDFEEDFILSQVYEMNRGQWDRFFVGENFVLKYDYDDFKDSVNKLQSFIQIFKSDLIRIDIDRKEDGEDYVCRLNLVYESYSIDLEFESTGIKKLVKLFVYVQKMVEGGIVFIDEFDSNLHDVYLCALLEYLMDYGKGQLCFTTHNVGPMDVLKRHKKSIDFLSTDHQIYPWTKNGNYSPSKLYRNGMIQGSPFNIDSIDFIGVFDRPDGED